MTTDFFMPPTEFSIFGLTFHLYGLIVGLSLLLGVTLAEKILKRVGYTDSNFWQLTMIALLGGLIGARAWHVMTDWQLYVNNWVASWYVWQGGLSILGAVVGGLIAVVIYDHWQSRQLHKKAQTSRKNSSILKQNFPLLVFFDAAAIALPFAQALGRLANWVNQELFGPPTNLPWGILIQVEFRPIEYLSSTHFHPLFLYEMLLNLLIGGFLLAIYFKNYQLPKTPTPERLKQTQIRKQVQDSSLYTLNQLDRVKVRTYLKKAHQVVQKFKLGSGNYLLAYLLFYSGVRFGLDFIRIEKSVILGGLLGLNQLVLLGVMIVALVQLKRNLAKF